jgi:hypothetical protein
MGERSAPGTLEPRLRSASSTSPAEAASAQTADLSGVLGRAIAALADATGANRVAAWGRGPDGALAVLAARAEGAELHPPSEAAWRSLAARAGPTDLAGSPDPALSTLGAGARLPRGRAAAKGRGRCGRGSWPRSVRR